VVVVFIPVRFSVAITFNSIIFNDLSTGLPPRKPLQPEMVELNDLKKQIEFLNASWVSLIKKTSDLFKLRGNP
jgi:hypothetical protein